MEKKSLSFWHPASLIATFLGVGKIPVAPGTWGSLAAFPFLWLVSHAIVFFIPASASPEMQLAGSMAVLLVVLALLFIIGIWASHVYVRESGKEDPGEIVIDEVVGQGLVIVAVIPLSLLQPVSGWFLPITLVAAFALFRLFDIRKPWPINWCDQNIKGGFGVMLDDVVAAIMATVIFYAGWFIYEDITAMAVQ